MWMQRVSFGVRTVAGKVNEFKQYPLISFSGDFADARHELKAGTYDEDCD